MYPNKQQAIQVLNQGLQKSLQILFKPDKLYPKGMPMIAILFKDPEIMFTDHALLLKAFRDQPVCLKFRKCDYLKKEGYADIMIFNKENGDQVTIYKLSIANLI